MYESEAFGSNYQDTIGTPPIDMCFGFLGLCAQVTTPMYQTYFSAKVSATTCNIPRLKATALCICSLIIKKAHDRSQMALYLHDSNQPSLTTYQHMTSPKYNSTTFLSIWRGTFLLWPSIQSTHYTTCTIAPFSVHEAGNYHELPIHIPT